MAAKNYHIRIISDMLRTENITVTAYIPTLSGLL